VRRARRGVVPRDRARPDPEAPRRGAAGRRRGGAPLLPDGRRRDAPHRPPVRGPVPAMSGEDEKRAAAEAAVAAEVGSGMVLGLGTGTTASHVVITLGRLLRDGALHDIGGVPTSEATAELAREHGVPLATLDEQPRLRVCLDGADEIGPGLALVKGLGGALLREKIVASAADRFVVVADASKRVARLGEHAPVPVE